MVTPELVEEHRTNPLGFHGLHSFELQFLMNYLRTRPQAGKYVIVAVEAWKDYRIGVLSGVRGVEPQVLDEPRFATEEEAMHGVFLARIRDILGVEA
jgi:branched-chain amino acid transport system permease protein